MSAKSEETIRFSIRIPKSVHDKFFSKAQRQNQNPYDLLKTWIACYADSEIDPSSLEKFMDLISLHLLDLSQELASLKQMNLNALILLSEKERD